MAKYALLIALGEIYEETESKYSSFMTDKNISRLTERLNAKNWDNIDPILNRNASKNQIISAIRELIKKLQKGDTLLFYYFGHADKSLDDGTGETTDDSKDEEMITFDKQMISDRPPYDPAIFFSDNDYYSIMYSYFKMHPDIFLYSIFDCCYALGLIDGKLMDLPNHFVLASSSALEKSITDPKQGSYFNMALYEASSQAEDLDSYCKHVSDFLERNKYPKSIAKIGEKIARTPLII